MKTVEFEMTYINFNGNKRNFRGTFQKILELKIQTSSETKDVK